MLVERQASDSCLIREGYYIEYAEDGSGELWVVKTTKTLFLEKKFIAKMDFIPVTWYSPVGDPNELYPKGWFVDMLPLEREVNELIQKMSMIIKTG
jgi:hypothetical protein